MLQTRNGKRTAKAALKIAVDMADEGLDHEARSGAAHRSGLARSAFCIRRSIPKAERNVDRHGPSGIARRRLRRDRVQFRRSRAAATPATRSFWCASKPAPKIFTACTLREGILTTRGGMTSHAAVVARGMGKPCVSGAGSLRIDYAKRHDAASAARPSKKAISSRSTARTGQVIEGAVPMLQPELSGDFATLMGWADSVRRMGVRANAETPADARDGAQIRRRRHRPLPHRTYVLRSRPHRRRARDDPGR